jgi:hypothetical protein
MNILRLAAELFLIYMLYKFIFEFIIPIYNTSRKVQKQFNQMQEKMNKQQQDAAAPPSSPTGKTPGTEGEYIDYEEVK